MNGMDQRGHRIIRRPRIFRELMGCQPNPWVGASQYVSSKTISHMKWHVDGCMKGEMMRHPIDS